MNDIFKYSLYHVEDVKREKNLQGIVQCLIKKHFFLLAILDIFRIVNS